MTMREEREHPVPRTCSGWNRPCLIVGMEDNIIVYHIHACSRSDPCSTRIKQKAQSMWQSLVKTLHHIRLLTAHQWVVSVFETGKQIARFSRCIPAPANFCMWETIMIVRKMRMQNLDDFILICATMWY